MLDGLFVTPAVTAIEEALGSVHAEGPIAVVGSARLAKAFGLKREVIAVGLATRAAKKAPAGFKQAELAMIESTSLASVIGVDADVAILLEWTRVVRDGGAIVMVDRGHAADAARRALCAGLTELEQRHAGRLVITSGLVTHL